MFIHQIRVRGFDTFPIDMLRFDCCYPATMEDADLIATSVRSESREHRTVVLQRASSYGTTLWAIERWKSFGWSVNILEVRQGQPNASY